MPVSWALGLDSIKNPVTFSATPLTYTLAAMIEWISRDKTVFQIPDRHKIQRKLL
jgi:hypothetical protein